MENKDKKKLKQSINSDVTNETIELGKSIKDKPSTREIGGREGLEPTRYGDWEKNGRCIDF